MSQDNGSPAIQSQHSKRPSSDNRNSQRVGTGRWEGRGWNQPRRDTADEGHHVALANKGGNSYKGDRASPQSANYPVRKGRNRQNAGGYNGNNNRINNYNYGGGYQRPNSSQWHQNYGGGFGNPSPGYITSSCDSISQRHSKYATRNRGYSRRNNYQGGRSNFNSNDLGDNVWFEGVEPHDTRKQYMGESPEDKFTEKFLYDTDIAPPIPNLSIIRLSKDSNSDVVPPIPYMSDIQLNRGTAESGIVQDGADNFVECNHCELVVLERHWELHSCFVCYDELESTTVGNSNTPESPVMENVEEPVQC